MPNIVLTHELNCDTDTFWKIFFDKAFNETLFRKKLGFPRFDIVEQREDDREIFRKVSGQPKMDLPGPVAKLVGSSFTYVEEGRFDRASKTWKWKMTPSTLADKMRTEGTVRAEASGTGKCKRIANMLIEAKMFGIGGLMESSAEKNMRDGWDKSALYINEWIAEGHAK